MSLPSATVPSGHTLRRRRVLLVGSSRFWQWMVFDSFAEDYEVTSCPGPELVAGGCPVLAGQGCPLIERVDVIVTGRDSSRPDNLSVIGAARMMYPGKAMITSEAG